MRTAGDSIISARLSKNGGSEALDLMLTRTI